LPAQWRAPQPAPGLPVAAAAGPRVETIPFDWAHEAARHVGTVAHRVFAQIAREGLDAWSTPRAGLAERIRAELAAEGVDGAELADAMARVLAAADAMLTEERGRWLLDPTHAEARSEWALAAVEDGAVARIVIDRTFVVSGTRWIVDFKTGVHEGADLDAFLDREVARYRAQLERYARFIRLRESRPICVGLYFPLQRAWRAWAYDG